MHALRSGLAICVAGLLSACFMSETPFLSEGELVRIADGPILVCSEADDCSRAEPDETDKAYVIQPPEDEADELPMPIRFAPLMETQLGPVWLAEIDMTDEDEAAYVVGVVRRAPEFDRDGLMGFEVELPWCEDVSDEDLATFGIERLDQYTCSLPAKTSIAEYLRQTHGPRLGDPAWWQDN